MDCMVQLCATVYADTKHGNNVYKLYDQFNGIVAKLLDDLAPVTQFIIREHYHRPWFDAESQSIRKSMRRFEHQFKANKVQLHVDAWRAALKSSKKQSHAKAAGYWKQKLTGIGNNCHRIWQTINSLLSEKKVSMVPIFSATDYHDYINKKIANMHAVTSFAGKPYSSIILPSIFVSSSVSVLIRLSPTLGSLH